MTNTLLRQQSLFPEKNNPKTDEISGFIVVQFLESTSWNYF